ncbi:MAG: hypothetical protein KC416_13250 [Myxococcales bacterium]|nr:hypothetical protein [Myxococcales bacterium]
MLKKRTLLALPLVGAFLLLAGCRSEQHRTQLAPGRSAKWTICFGIPESKIEVKVAPVSGGQRYSVKVGYEEPDFDRSYYREHRGGGERTYDFGLWDYDHCPSVIVKNLGTGKMDAYVTITYDLEP